MTYNTLQLAVAAEAFPLVVQAWALAAVEAFPWAFQ
ncbi:hypothetical protein A2U01_0111417, partial [Trifolium medium]|nr:hypothetical protein [Trifolium medium]